MGVAHQQDEDADGEQGPPAVGQACAAKEEEEQTQRIVATQDIVFEEKVVAKEDADLYGEGKGGVPEEDKGDGRGDEPLQNLHGYGIRGQDMGDKEEEGMPEPGMSVITGIVVEIGERGAVAGQQEMMGLVEEQLVGVEAQRAEDHINGQYRQYPAQGKRWGHRRARGGRLR